MAQEIDEEIYRLIDEAHQRAARLLREHEHELHTLAAILIEHETIDKDQFERLLAGEPEEQVFAEDQEAAQPETQPEAERKRLPKPSPRPFPAPGRALQPPPPEGASS